MSLQVKQIFRGALACVLKFIFCRIVERASSSFFGCDWMNQRAGSSFYLFRLHSHGLCMIVILVAASLRSLGAPAAPVPPPSNEFKPQLNNSVYETAKPRDPFLPPGVSGVVSSNIKAADPTVFHLDGFLGSTNNLTAIVNGLALSLNKPVVVETETGRITIKAVQISLSGVVLEVGGKRVELKRVSENVTAPAPR